MIRYLVAVGFASLVSLGSYAADKEDAPKLAGTWTKDADGLALTMTFVKAGELKFKIETPDSSITFFSTYTVEKDGLIKTKLTKKELKGEFPFVPKDDFTYNFKVKVDGKTATISDFSASEGDENGKAIVEGKYKMKEEK